MSLMTCLPALYSAAEGEEEHQEAGGPGAIPGQASSTKEGRKSFSGEKAKEFRHR